VIVSGAPVRRPGHLRLIRLHVVSRQVPAALAAVLICAVGLWVAGHWPWDAYGARQLPLIFEAACAAAIAVTTASPFGEPERATGWSLPVLRLGVAVSLTAGAAGALIVAGAGAHPDGGAVDVVRNVAGLTGIGLLCAAGLRGALAWAGPAAYMMIGVYALYTQWHGPALTSPWIWPARPPHDLAASICAGLVFAAGAVVIMAYGARDRIDD
jgi:hypothetical protein